ncbi:TPA: tRNA 2-thiocytidine(32) synthetase TtcA [Pseudomonas aeruginosa]|jgi:tRNA 2-thiocytidine biosynthesis protein TtcA|uniref:tRNA-cytidine(32) 2-sulfurtransferase n=8 Tax=Pseudomonadales TaxID=72274 RepID=A0ABQ4W7V9_9PSED|nr:MULTISPECIES: tRNA 2-thiocytidine(32) synthetase TtcA [Pseudomonadaceae]WOF80135.1 tRNA 2-thiocytidine(32) synthetase TtcA [Pseudomonas sp. FeN3W]EKJ7124748.1 tRNA 2-thiocytidine(32) synthetase TtcA [Pseudomonas aeruginosa]EKX6392179.1 tRNA 2-thiocytidine(32) synthetase TtcA [Pseudomonas aeruginosa]ELB6601656.1 tRNA 2-thiocytidine(32) synthetase TtcA [Pseudomonas aeruginosa]ELD1891920.1 tRNA 2-thiocytidine(32) synthetase TtcA [Pseudomonas aeruginosa]
MMMGEQVSQINKAAELRRKKLRGNVGKAVVDYAMIEDGDKVMACVSGGKDSFVMLDALLHLQRVAQIKFSVVAVNLDQKQPGFPEHILPEFFEAKGIDYYIIDKDTYSVVKSKIPEGKTTCSLCSRLRRGTLYSFAEEIGATKLALGHHMDDMVETLFLNMFFQAQLKGMPPKLLSDDKRNIVIRPLAYCREKDIAKVAADSAYPIIPCNLCGSQENLQRKKIKSMIAEWDSVNPGCVENIFHSLQNVSPSQLADRSLFDFIDLSIDRSDVRPPYEFEAAEVSSSSVEGRIDVVRIL